MRIPRFSWMRRIRPALEAYAELLFALGLALLLYATLKAQLAYAAAS